MKETNTDLIIYTDIDFPYTLESVEAMFKELQKGTDVTLGHRGQEYYKKTPWFYSQSHCYCSVHSRYFITNVFVVDGDDGECR